MADLANVWIGGVQFGVGESNKITASNLGRYVTNLELGDATPTHFGHPLVGGGTADTGQVYATPRVITCTLVLDYNTTNPERNLRHQVNTYAETFGGDGGVIQFRVDRLDSGGSTVSRFVDCKLTQYPQSQSPQLVHVNGASYGWMMIPLAFQTVGTPMWATRAADTSNTEALNTASQAWSFDNDGSVACGLKWVFSDIVGTWTSCTVANTTTGQTVTVTSAGLANTELVDFKTGVDATTGFWGVDWSSTMTLDASNLGPMTMARGTNSGTVIGVGGTSGTVTFHLRELWHTV